MGSWWHKTFIVFVPDLTTEIWHPSTNKPVFEGGVGLNTICQGTQEVSHPHTHEIKGRKISVLTVVSAVAHEPALSSLSLSPVVTGNTTLNSHTWRRVLMWKSRFSQEELQHTLEKKIYKFGFIGLGKRNSSTLPSSPLPQRRHRLRLIENFLGPWFLPQGKGGVCVWFCSFLICMGSAKRLISLSFRPEY